MALSLSRPGSRLRHAQESGLPGLGHSASSPAFRQLGLGMKPMSAGALGSRPRRRPLIQAAAAGSASTLNRWPPDGGKTFAADPWHPRTGPRRPSLEERCLFLKENLAKNKAELEDRRELIDWALAMKKEAAKSKRMKGQLEEDDEGEAGEVDEKKVPVGPSRWLQVLEQTDGGPRKMLGTWRSNSSMRETLRSTAFEFEFQV
mmetsp:Transcript_156879/g.277066  ORF Transcript_156879/g.277066 Transcript_156879/m.277066 type:complete len:203 (+) Transcript_156879:76-684(+)